MRLFILISIFIPAAFLLFGWGIARFYEPDHPSGAFSFSTQDLRLYGIDGAQLALSYSRLSGKGRKGRKESPVKIRPPLFVFIADPYLDRDWNASTFHFKSGRWLAQALASFGIESIRYDHRGTGQSPASPATRHDFELKAHDLRVIHAYAREQKPRSLVVLAHGNDACALLLYALDRWDLPMDGLVLLSCGAQGDLLETWGRKLFFNMRRKGVKEDIITKAKKEWQVWKNSTKIQSMAGEQHPDLKAFRSALNFLASEERASFRKAGKDLDFFALLRKEIRRGTPILHMNALYDEERPLSEQEASRSFARQMQRHIKTHASYRFVEMDRCDHFLKEQDRIVEGFALTWERLNPLRPLQPQIVHMIMDSASVWDWL